MKHVGCLIVLSLISVGFISAEEAGDDKITVYSNDQNGLESVITNQALDSFNTKYQRATKHKAFAQSLSGAWSWKSNRTSEEHAKTSALVGCQKSNKKSENIYPCKIIHVNDRWLE